ncbi:MAG TPA: DmsC/YnfH family molybdoenzyme membrane anchor subunit [Usitatibacter sp.]|nr:DmsC/YnfH family molybdoenzyme membrane anchor subunit [Usitatibacter sp.]
MRPAFSVVFLTTLIGAGQGLAAALFAAEAGARAGAWPMAPRDFFVAGAAAAVGLAALGLFASFFHLGRPERAWRTAAMWRTSWLSREVIALPAFIAAAAGYGAAHAYAPSLSIAAGALALLACIALFVCTAMVYAGIKFFQEWASPLTLANFALIGTASGFTLASAMAARMAPELAPGLAAWAAVLTLAALVTRAASLLRNARLRPRSTLQSAIGIAHPRIEQKSRGFTGQSFNTQEFFHGASPEGMRGVMTVFLQMGFLIPIVLLVAGMKTGSADVLAAAFAIQYAGLIVERWFFLAQATHPQNLYYQGVS